VTVDGGDGGCEKNRTGKSVYIERDERHRRWAGCRSEKRENEHVTLPGSLLLTRNSVFMRRGDLVK
jgi:hypothetical protein